MWPVAIVITTTLIAIALRRTRWASPSLLASRIAYGLLVLTPLVYFPARAGLRTTPWRCEWTFDTALAVHSLTNYRHIILFAIFFLLTYAQLPGVRRAMWWSMGACIAMGVFVELAQGATGAGHCRMRDMIPNTVGALIGAGLVAAGRNFGARLRIATAR